YLRARHYDTQTGRFLTRDPFGGFPGDPLSLHKYFYAAANPVNNQDPSGQITFAGVYSATLVLYVLATIALDVTYTYFSPRGRAYHQSDPLTYVHELSTQVAREAAQCAVQAQLTSSSVNTTWFGNIHTTGWEESIRSGWLTILNAITNPLLDF